MTSAFFSGSFGLLVKALGKFMVLGSNPTLVVSPDAFPHLLPSQTFLLTRKDFVAIATPPPTRRTASTPGPPPASPLGTTMAKPVWITGPQLLNNHPLQMCKLLRAVSQWSRYKTNAGTRSGWAWEKDSLVSGAPVQERR